MVIHRTAWQQVGPFDARLKGGEDWEMWIRLAKHGSPACIFSPLVARRLHDSNATLDVDAMVRGIRLIEKLHRTKADWGKLHRWLAHSYLRAGSRRAALAQFARAAIRGQGRAVAIDLSVIIKAVVATPTLIPKDESARSADHWVATAAAWMEDLRTSLDGGWQVSRAVGSLKEQGFLAGDRRVRTSQRV